MTFPALPQGVLLWVGLQVFGQDPTAEAILTRHIAAVGGAAKLRAISSLRIKGVQVLLPSPLELPMVIEQKRPNLQRVEVTVRGTRITTFDGKDGWIKTPWAANKEAEPLRPEEIKALSETDFDTPYLDWQTKGWTAEYLGRALSGSRTVHRVKLTLSNTDSLIGSFDASSFMEVFRERCHRELGNEVVFTSTFDDHRAVNGLQFPFYVLHRAEHRGRRLKLFVDSVEVNPQLPDSRFTKP